MSLEVLRKLSEEMKGCELEQKEWFDKVFNQGLEKVQ